MVQDRVVIDFLKVRQLFRTIKVLCGGTPKFLKEFPKFFQEVP